MPNQTDPTQQHTDIPPLPDFMVSAGATQASAPDNDIPPEIPPVITSSPKKTFGGKRIIATILGLVLLVGGVTAGVALNGQRSTVTPKASGECGCSIGTTQSCTASNGNIGTEKCVADSTTCGIGTAYNIGKWGNCSAGDITCNSPKMVCQGQCIDVSSDNNNCGICGFKCSSDYTCQSGNCLRPSGYCSNDVNCANGYMCNTTSHQCEASTNTSCKTGDLGAPVCCTGPCTSTPVCEAPHRQECISSGVNGSNLYCTIKVNATECNGGTPPPTGNPTPTPGSTAQCVNVKAYSATWAPLTTTELSALPGMTQVNFCVTGTASAGTFDKAKFTIDGVTGAETTTVRPGSTDFCQSYTIPVVMAAKTINVSAQIHHVTLGWF